MNKYSVYAWLDDLPMSAKLAKVANLHSYDLIFIEDHFTVFGNDIPTVLIVDLLKLTENDLKNFLVEYVGERSNPKDKKVTVEMIVDTMAQDFTEFILAIAEENWIRGYQQAIQDVDEGIRIEKENDNGNAVGDLPKGI